MVRTKKTPQHQKRDDLSLGSCSLSTIGEFIPLFRKKRQSKGSSTTQTFEVLLVKEEQKKFYVGDLRVGSSSNVLPENMSSCRISFKSDEDGRNTIVLRFEEEFVIVTLFEDITFLKDFILSKVLSFEIYTQEDSVYFKVYLINIPLPKLNSKVAKCIQTAFRLFSGIQIGEETKNVKTQHSLTNTEITHLYETLMNQRDMSYYSVELSNLSLLKPNLRPYQKQALQWMIYRETQANLDGLKIDPLYQKITLKSNIDVYLDKYTGWIEENPPLVQSTWKGGILADEMGLGKTVEVLALILSNRSNEGLGANNCDGQFQNGSSDHDNDELIITYQSKKRRLPLEGADEEEVDVKKTKNADDKNKTKSATYLALQTIYNRTLSEYCTTGEKTRHKKRLVQCICGGDQKKGTVECEICGKMQHSTCLGYQSKKHGPYKCPQCWENIELINSRATLIVAPAALRRQWCREMKTHLRAGIRVLNYEGNSATPIYPSELQDYEIVITTYNVLQSELRLTETGQTPNLRGQRKYWPGGSPLVRVIWWRLCLDEAQTVETPGRIVSLMAKKISAQHRWAVTGTPMAKGVADMFGLIDYLQMEPYNDPDTWKHILYNPYINGNTEPMYNFLSKVLWRTSKASVLDQINIPKQTHELHLLEFSAVEKFYYSREHNICAKDFLQIAKKFPDDLLLEKMDRSNLKKLMAPFLCLRQACSDPSAVRGKGRYLSMKRNASSMKDLLDALILKNRNDCEESLRLMVSAINGLAGIYLLLQDKEQAVREYRKVLQLSAEFAEDGKQGKLSIDKLLLIHAMHNLAEVLQNYQPEERTLRDDSLVQDCLALEKQYIEKFMKETAAAKEICKSFTDTVNKHENELTLKHGQWYSDGFDWVSNSGLDQDLFGRIELATVNANLDYDWRKETVRSLLRLAFHWHDSLIESRYALFQSIEGLYVEDEESKRVIIQESLLQKAMNCHLRPQKKGKKAVKCNLCITNVHLKDYESLLYTMKKRTQSYEEFSLQGSWKPKFEELLLKGLLSLLKSKNVNPAWINDGETHILLIESLKKEFKEIRKFWTLLDGQVCAQDELDICKVRLELKTQENKDKAIRVLKTLSYENKSTHENINLISLTELPHQELSLRSEETRRHSLLQSLLGTRNYLETLKQQQFEGYTPDPCPICHGPLVKTWAILSCAHTYCLNCFKTMLNKISTTIQCCVCRAEQNLQDVAYINSGTNGSENSTENKMHVVGNYSRKVEDVVRLILKLREEDHTVKILLFSTWALVLQLLKKALDQNNIKSELADGNSAFERRIETFKDPIQKVTVLLLPIRLGSKGLNLIEATHVVLLEPLLNPADELQAIGRVHRIGQTKPTFVHKFLVKNTVEESIHNATTTDAAGWEESKLTVGQLKGLFMSIVLDEDDSEADHIENEDVTDIAENIEVVEEGDEESKIEGIDQSSSVSEESV